MAECLYSYSYSYTQLFLPLTHSHTLHLTLGIYRIFSVITPISAMMIDNIQNRIVTCVSLQ